MMFEKDSAGPSSLFDKVTNQEFSNPPAMPMTKAETGPAMTGPTHGSFAPPTAGYAPPPGFGPADYGPPGYAPPPPPGFGPAGYGPPGYAPPPPPGFGPTGYSPPGFGIHGASGYGAIPPFDRGMVSSQRLTAGVLALLLGGIGAHKFYLGFNTSGIITVLLTFGTCGLACFLTLIEGLIYLTKSDEDFYRIYILGKKEWF